MIRKKFGFLIAAAAVSAVGCSPVGDSQTGTLNSGTAPGAVINQAAIYASGRVAFDKGPGGNHKGPGDNQGNGGNDGPGSACVMPDSLVLNVDSKGGNFAYNGSSFVVPKNAVNQSTHIVMIPQLDSTIAIQFYPEGLVFNQNAMPTLTINTDCIGDPANASIVYTDSSGTVLEHKKTKGKTQNTVSTDLAHFSRYAVAW